MTHIENCDRLNQSQLVFILIFLLLVCIKYSTFYNNTEMSIDLFSMDAYSELLGIDFLNIPIHTIMLPPTQNYNV